MWEKNSRNYAYESDVSKKWRMTILPWIGPEGMPLAEETLTLNRLGLFEKLGCSFPVGTLSASKTNNCIESLNSQVLRLTGRTVNKSTGGWVAACLILN